MAEYFYRYDSLTAAIHEVGHAVVQSLFEIGPEFVRISQEEDNGWKGQAGLSNFALGDACYAHALTSQLAGPIAQWKLAPNSLGELLPDLKPTILQAALTLPFDRFNMALWGTDLEDAVKFAKIAPLGYRYGGFLFEAESAMNDAFKCQEIQEGMFALAHELNDTKEFTRERFQKRAAHLLKRPEWSHLTLMDWDFVPVSCN